MSCLEVSSTLVHLLKDHKAERERLIYGYVDPPIMVECNYKDGSWEIPKLVQYQNLSLDPATKVLHYAQGIFEGMKAYNVGGNGPLLFRADEHFKRFDESASRLDIPEFPKNYFIDSLHGFVKHSSSYIPEETGTSLYLRPFIIATEVGLGPFSAKEFKFVLIGKYSRPYFGGEDGAPVFLEREYSRVGKGCTGNVKAISNYSSCLKIDREAKDMGYNITLWLDSEEGKYIEELSGMNFFCVLGDTLYTPKLTGTILSGITRKSIITLAKDLGYKVEEARLDINDLFCDTPSLLNSEGLDCNEMFACGTSAGIMPIIHLGQRDGSLFVPKHSYGPITKAIKEKLLSIQEGRSEDTYNWVTKVS